jgi:hypothetical protein
MLFCADTRNAKGQMALFTTDTRFEVFYDPKSGVPSHVINGREGLAPVFDDLNQYKATMHFNGQTSVQLNGDDATGIAYCIAHHLSVEDGKQKLMVAAIKYHDTYTRQNGKWLFAVRQLMVDWIEIGNGFFKLFTCSKKYNYGNQSRRHKQNWRSV